MSWGDWGFIDAPEVSYRLAMAWDEWSDKIRPRSGEGWQDYVIDHGPDEHEPEFEHQSSLSFTVSPNSVSVNDLYTAPLFRNRGVAEAFIRRLHEDYPEHKINPGSMTSDGQAFHDRMLQKEPAARDLVTAANRIIEAMAWQDWFGKIEHEYQKGNEYDPPGGVYYMPDEDSGLDYSYPDENTVRVDWLYTDPDYRKDGVAEALIRRLHQDHPNHRIDPGEVTEDGRAFHDKMLNKEPEAKSFVNKPLFGARDVVAQANRLIEAMVWHEWSDKIVRRQEDEDYTGSVSGRYVIPQAGAFLDYSHDTHMGRPAVKINGIYTHPSNRGDGVAEALMRRLYEDHPDKLINPGYMTPDGQKFHDRMLDKEPTAKDVVTAAIKLLGKCL